MVLFNEESRKELFTIAYAADDDFMNTAKNSIKMIQDKVAKYDPKTQRSLIKSEKKRVSEMVDDMQKESNMRTLMLSPNEMICIPQFGGCTGNAFQKQKTVYLICQKNQGDKNPPSQYLIINCQIVISRHWRSMTASIPDLTNFLSTYCTQVRIRFNQNLEAFDYFYENTQLIV